jgi:tetratricopeptide (TPR) repeat protein
MLDRSPADALAAWEATPLLGAPRRALLAGTAALAAALVDSPDPDVEGRLVVLGARLALAADAPGALDELLRADRIALRRADLPTHRRLRLGIARALARRERLAEAQDALAALAADVAADPALRADWALARAECGLGDIRTAWEDALSALPRPAGDHERRLAHESLAELHHSGGSSHAARHHFAQARAIALQHDDPVLAAHSGLALLGLLLEAGRPAEARPLVDTLWDEAGRIGDPLLRLALGSFRCALHLDGGTPATAAETALTIEALAWSRRNWLGVADARLTRATAAALGGDRDGAIVLLVDGLHRLVEVRAEAASHLLKARLAELRAAWGAADFDPRFDSIVGPPLPDDPPFPAGGEE